MKQAIALVGDVHGSHELMIRRVDTMARRRRCEVRLVLQIGDFETHRDEDDVATMAAPQKYRLLGDFHLVRTGKLEYPWPVYFIGGNHEPYGWLDQFPEGFTVAPNCHYLGRFGVTEQLGYRIVGLTGIYVERLFTAPRPQVSEFGSRSNKAYIGYTETEVERVLEEDACDILLLHDWPGGIVADEDWKDFPSHWDLAELGNEYTRLIIEALQPTVVACGHMHYPYRSEVPLANGEVATVICLADLPSDGGVVLLDEDLAPLE